MQIGVHGHGFACLEVVDASHQSAASGAGSSRGGSAMASVARNSATVMVLF